MELGGDNPVRLQSMTNTSTMDTAGSVAQTERIAEAGADIVRLTAQGVREAANIGVIRQELRSRGCHVPLVADIHFNPRAAFEAAGCTDKVRINPGNFVDPGRTFRRLEYTEEEYAAELDRIDAALTPFLELCRQHGTALRIGVNHGSLSDRIMSRYGDTPEGMTESAMEFLRVCRKRDFNNVVISIKASNVVVMVRTVRMLVRAMEAEGMDYPLHLGVTEAGDGEDARIKSAVGIGTLLAEGVGDTIRVSLSEAPEAEIPVARMLADYVATFADAPAVGGVAADGFDPLQAERRSSETVGTIGGSNIPAVVGNKTFGADVDAADTSGWLRLAAPLTQEQVEAIEPGRVVLLESSHANYPAAIRQAMHMIMSAGKRNPVVLHARYDMPLTADEAVVRASVDLGAPLLDGFADGIRVSGSALAPGQAERLAFGILQSTRLRITRTEYIACPGCGRTLFDLPRTLQRVKEATAGLTGLKIGVMGCVVNGPGEMADADYGYVGAGKGQVSLYRGRECVEKGIDQEHAVERLVELIKSDGRWT